jgi:hypothetical protein
MKRFLADRPMLGFFLVAVAATVVSSWILNPHSGPLALFTGGITWTAALKLGGVALIFLLGGGLTYIAMRLASDPRGFGLVPIGQSYTPGRRLNATSSVPAARTADDVLDDLDRMIGLGPVKAEVNKLLASIEVERKRREQGLPSAKPRWRARSARFISHWAYCVKATSSRLIGPVWWQAISGRPHPRRSTCASRRSTASCLLTKRMRSPLQLAQPAISVAKRLIRY